MSSESLSSEDSFEALELVQSSCEDTLFKMENSSGSTGEPKMWETLRWTSFVDTCFGD